MPDWAEYVAGTNPRDSNSIFRVSGVYDNQSHAFQLSWPSATNRLYTVLTATNGFNGWQAIAGAEDIPGTGQRRQYVQPISAGGGHFFRVTCSLPTQLQAAPAAK